MQLYNLASKAVEEVPDEDAQAAFTGGTHAFVHPDQPVPIKAPDGSLVQVAAKDAQKAMDLGGTIASQEEWHAADLDARYGGAGGALESIGEGVARGLSLGASDPIAIGLAKTFGGEATGEAVRQRLAGVKEAHPYLSEAGGIAGAALPVLLSEGAAAPEEAAVLGGAKLAPEIEESAQLAHAAAAHAEGAGAVASTPSLVRQILANTPAGLTSRLGTAADTAAGEVLGARVGKTALGRVTSAALRAGASGFAEGALYGAGNQWSEDALGNTDTSAEKLVAAAGHGALYGFLMAGGGAAGLTAAGEVAAPLLRRAAPTLDREAGKQMWKSLDPLKKYTTEAQEHAGGIADVGKTVLREIGLPGKSIGEAAMTPEELAPAINEAMRRKGAQLGDALTRAGADDAASAVTAAEIRAPIQGILGKLDATEGGRTVARQVRQYTDGLLEGLGVKLSDEEQSGIRAVAKGDADAAFPRVAKAAAVREERTGAEVAEYLKEHPEAASRLGPKGELPDDVRYKGKEPPPVAPATTEKWRAAYDGAIAKRTEAALAEKSGATKIPFRKLMDERMALDDLIYRETNPVFPSPREREMRAVRKVLADKEIEAIDRAARAIHNVPGVGAELKAVRREYQHLRLADSAVRNTTSRMATNRSHSLSDIMHGMPFHAAGLGAGLLTGHVGAGIAAAEAAGLAAKAGHKYLRTHGNALAAWALSRLSKLDLVARAGREVDDEIAHSAKVLVGRAKPRVRVRRFQGPAADATPEEKHAAVASHPYRQVEQEHVGAALGDTSQMPKTSSAVARVLNTGLAYVAATRPKALNAPSVLDPKAKPRVDPMESERSYQVHEAVHDPVGVLTRGLETGRLPKVQMQAVADNYPNLLADAQRTVMAELAKPHDPIPYERATALSLMLGIAADPTLDGAHIAQYQGTYAPQPPPKPAPQVGAPASPGAGGASKKPVETVAQTAMTTLQRIQLR